MLHDRLKAEFATMQITLTAIDLWHYQPDGTWDMAASVEWATHPSS